MRPWILPVVAVLILLTSSQPALAHPGHDRHSFLDGVQHPLVGLDHLLAMIAVGLLAVRIGGRALWIMPCTFMGSMLAGGIAATLGVFLPGAEYMIACSVLALGLLIAVTRVAPLPVAAALVALFAVFHGYAHASEMASSGSFAAYSAGFLLATAALHAAGVLGGALLSRQSNSAALRFSGGVVAAAGFVLVCGLI